MSTGQDSLGAIATELAKILEPLKEVTAANAKPFFLELGIPVTDAQAASLGPPIGVMASKTEELVAIIPELIAALSADDWGTALEKALEASVKIGETVSSLDQLSVSAAGLAVPDAGELASRIFSFLLAQRLDAVGSLNGLLEFTGLLERHDFNMDSADPAAPPYTVHSFHLDAIGEWMRDPAGKARSLWGWGPGFNGDLLFPRIEKLLAETGAPVFYDSTASPKRLDIVFLELLPATSGPAGLTARLKNSIATGPQVIELGPEFRLELNAEFAPPIATELTIHTDGTASFLPPTPTALSGHLDTKFVVEKPDPHDPFLLFGVAGGSRFQFGNFIFGAGGGFQWNGGGAAGDLNISGALNAGKVVIDATQGDGFLSKILPGTHIEADFSLLMGISTERGFYFSGSSALEIRLPAHIALGPVSIEGLTISAALRDSQLPVSLGADIKGALGPIEAVVQNMGVTATLSFPPQNRGNLGPLQLDVGFKPPNGVGLRVDAGPITGGGFLSLDFDKGEYFGALELSFKGIFTLKAVGIINTKLPDGSKGFALLILITAEFTPIQLGFGFTLLGVGGLLGHNHSLDTDALRLGVRTGAVSSILFPPDVVGNIARIVSDLKSFFPITVGHFVVAPMGKLGWGTPTLISLELGVILDIPSPQFTIIGVLRCILPEEHAPILRLQVNFAGGIDFDRGLIWFDASLFDSNLLVYTLSGDMAVRISWGDQSIFVISIGGFHPAFHEVPSDLTGMRRLTIALMSGENPRLIAQAYFAITSNTVQSGARLELYAAAAGFNINGYLGFDLLIQFDPFSLLADIYAGLALRRGTHVLFSIDVHCRLSGPTPWHANGDGSFKILFVRIHVGFDVTWGDDTPALPSGSENVLDLLLAAARDSRNWRAAIPVNSAQTVTLRQVEPPEGTVLLHPFGILSVSQKIVPLGVPIDRFGNKKPSGDTSFEMSWEGGGSEPAKEEFAIANFLTLSDNEKLSRKSFEKMRSGLTLSTGDSTAMGAPVEKDVSYELSYVHKKRGLVIKGGLVLLLKSMFDRLALGGAVSESPLSAARRKAGGNGPARVEVAGEEFHVVKTSDLSLAGAGTSALGQAEAYALHDQLVRDDPSLAGTLQVMGSHELFMAEAA